MDSSFQEISKPRTVEAHAAGLKNERSVAGIMQWIKLTKYLANNFADVTSLTEYLNRYAIWENEY